MNNRLQRFVAKWVGGLRVVAATVLVLSASTLMVRAEVLDLPAKADQIILRVSATTPLAEVNTLAATANCSVWFPLAYSPGYYVLTLNSSRAARTGRAERPDTIPSPELKAAVEKLRSNSGVLADPNYLVYMDGVPGGGAQAAPIFRTSPVRLPQTISAGAARGRGRVTEPASTITFSPTDPYFSGNHMYGLKMVRMPEAWAVQADGIGRPVVVAVIDSGMEVTQPDIGPNVLISASKNFTVAVPDQNINDTVGHGTHVAGTIAAVTNNGIGVASVAGYTGGGVQTRILVCKVFEAKAITDAGGSPLAGTTGAITAAINYAASQNVDVMNFSLGGARNVPFAQLSAAVPTYVAAFNSALAQGITLCASAGNGDPMTGQGQNSVQYPSDIPGVIKVGAVGPDGMRSTFSDYGGSIAITAPGGSGDFSSEGTDNAIWSTWPSTVVEDGTGIGGYYSINGTSMSCPHVSGAAALLIACGAPRDPVQIKLILQTAAKPIPGDTPSFSGGNLYGAGLLDVYSAILPYANPPFTVAIPNAVSASVLNPGVSPVDALAAGDLPYVDMGQTYATTENPITIAVRGITRRLPTDVVTLEIRTATSPSTVLRTYTANDPGPLGFDIPITLPAGKFKATLFNIQVPRPTNGTPLAFPDGRYRAELKLNGVVQAVVFFEKISRTQPLGRALFSTPFQTRLVDANTPEQTLFGTSAVFSLARYNPLRLPSDFEYAQFQSAAGGRSDAAARFSASALNGAPLSFDTSNPTVSVAPVGLGYWLKLNSSATLDASGPVVTNPVGVRCYAANGGWNMIGDPFPFAVSFGTVTIVDRNNKTYSLTDAVAAGIISGALVGFPNGDYVYDVAPGGVLQPFNGYWVRVFQDCTLIIPPAGTGATRAASVKNNSIASAIAAWQVRLGATVAGDRDGQNMFGQVKNGTSRLALAKPPSGAGHAYVRFVEDATGRAQTSGPLAYDLRTGNGDKREKWTAQVSTDKADADVVLTWDGLGTAPRRANLYLTDKATGKKVALRDRSSYTYRSGEAGSTRSFDITLEPGFSSGPLAITNLSVVSMGRAVGGGVAVRFATTHDAEVSGVVRTLTGKRVGVLNGAGRATASASTTLRWDGRGEGGSALPAGAYQLEISVRDADGQTATVKQTVQSVR